MIIAKRFMLIGGVILLVSLPITIWLVSRTSKSYDWRQQAAGESMPPIPVASPDEDTLLERNNVNQFQADKVVFRIGDKEVNGEEFTQVANSLFPNTEVAGDEALIARVEEFFLRETIEEQEATKRKIEITEEEIDEKINNEFLAYATDEQKAKFIGDSLFRRFTKEKILRDTLRGLIEKEKKIALDDWIRAQLEKIEIVRDY